MPQSGAGTLQIEACEQCGVLSVPDIREPVRLIGGWAENEPGRRFIFCDEGEQSQNPLDALSGVERDLLRRNDFVIPVPLGPRVLRADTAAVAALAVVQATLGDWR